MRHAYLIALALVAGSAQADVVATFTQRASDVQLEVTGSLDLALLGNSFLTGTNPSSVLLTAGGFRAGLPPSTPSITYLVNNYYVSFGSGSHIGSYLSGPNVSFDNNGTVDQVRIQSDYVSGSSFTTLGTFAGDLAGLGITSLNPVVMQFTGSGPGAGTQTLTVQFAISPVPEPQSAALMLAGLGVLGLAAKRRRS